MKVAWQDGKILSAIIKYKDKTPDELQALIKQGEIDFTLMVMQDGKILSAVIKYKDKTPDELQRMIKQGEIDFALMAMQDGICSIGNKR